MNRKWIKRFIHKVNAFHNLFLNVGYWKSLCYYADNYTLTINVLWTKVYNHWMSIFRWINRVFFDNVLTNRINFIFHYIFWSLSLFLYLIHDGNRIYKRGFAVRKIVNYCQKIFLSFGNPIIFPQFPAWSMCFWLYCFLKGNLTESILTYCLRPCSTHKLRYTTTTNDSLRRY